MRWSEFPNLSGLEFHRAGHPGGGPAVSDRIAQCRRVGGPSRSDRVGYATVDAHRGSRVRRGRLLRQVLDLGGRQRTHGVIRGADGADRRDRLLRAAAHRAVRAWHELQQGFEHRQCYRSHEYRSHESRRGADRRDVRRPRLHRGRAELCGLRHLDARLPSVLECGPAVRRNDEHAERSAQRKTLSAATSDNGKLFITGFSEGGHVAMATQRAMQAAGATVTAAAPISGPYALEAFGDAIFFGSVNLGSTVFGPLLTTSYQHAYGNIYSAPTDIYNATYASGIETVLPSATPIATLFAN